MPHGYNLINQTASTPSTALLPANTPSGACDYAVNVYGSFRCRTAATLGVAVFSMSWFDGYATQSKVIASISLLSLTSSPFNFGFAFDYGAGISYQVDLIGVLGSPSYDLSFIFEPLSI